MLVDRYLFSPRTAPPPSLWPPPSLFGRGVVGHPSKKLVVTDNYGLVGGAFDQAVIKELTPGIHKCLQATGHRLLMLVSLSFAYSHLLTDYFPSLLIIPNSLTFQFIRCTL